ncbi:signal recognition particle 14 kDa protein-like isoform X3 [Coffea arabica]
MFERSTEKGSVWVTLKYSSDKSKLQRNKMKTAGEKIEYKCLIRATDGKKTISTLTDLYIYAWGILGWAKRSPAFPSFICDHSESPHDCIEEEGKKGQEKGSRF